MAKPAAQDRQPTGGHLNWQGSKPCSKRIGAGLPAPVRFVFEGGSTSKSVDSARFPQRRRARPGTFVAPANYSPGRKSGEGMLVERGIQVLNVEIVGDSYAIAANYLRKTGALSDTLVTDERLLRIIIRMFQHGEYNRLKLANRAIAEFEAPAAP
jgi:hypothetical protein